MTRSRHFFRGTKQVIAERRCGAYVVLLRQRVTVPLVRNHSLDTVAVVHHPDASREVSEVIWHDDDLALMASHDVDISRTKGLPSLCFVLRTYFPGLPTGYYYTRRATCRHHNTRNGRFAWAITEIVLASVVTGGHLGRRLLPTGVCKAMLIQIPSKQVHQQLLQLPTRGVGDASPVG